MAELARRFAGVHPVELHGSEGHNLRAVFVSGHDFALMTGITDGSVNTRQSLPEYPCMMSTIPLTHTS
jgi:hypothetical protein